MRILFALAVLLPLAAAPALARAQSQGGGDGHDGHDRHGAEDGEEGARARAALRAGEIKPLAALMGMVETRYAGRVVDARLDREHGRWTYELRVLPASGRMFEVRVDAATGAVLGTRGPAPDRRREHR